MLHYVLAAVVATTLPAPAAAQQWFVPVPSADTQRVSTQGIGEVPVPAARATAIFVFHSDGDDVAAAAADAAALTRNAVEALNRLGLDPSDWSLVSFGAGPAAGAIRPRAPGQSVPPRVEEARAGLRVSIDPVDRLDEVVAAVLGAGAESVVNVVFEPQEDPAVHAEAARIALAGARTEAESLADAAGMRLGRLLMLSSSPDFVRQSLAGAMFRATVSQGVPLTPSDLTVRVTLQATWELLPR